MNGKGGGEWWLVNRRLVDATLADESPETRARVHEAIGRLLTDPQSPDGIVTYPLRGLPTRTYPDRLLARLPDGWVLTYSLHPD